MGKQSLAGTAAMIGTKKFKDNVKKFTQAMDLSRRVLKAFEHFIHYTWGFETNVTNEIMINLTRQEREEFYMDMSHVSWRVFMYTYIHGLKRYTL